MNEDETPFAHIPDPDVIYEPPSALTPQGEIAFFGAMARGASGLPVRRVLGIIALLLFLGITIVGLVSVFISD